MSFEYLAFLSFICIVFIISFVVFYTVAMKTDDECGVGIYGSAISIGGVLILSLVISLSVIVKYLKH